MPKQLFTTKLAPAVKAWIQSQPNQAKAIEELVYSQIRWQRKNNKAHDQLKLMYKVKESNNEN